MKRCSSSPTAVVGQVEPVLSRTFVTMTRVARSPARARTRWSIAWELLDAVAAVNTFRGTVQAEGAGRISPDCRGGRRRSRGWCMSRPSARIPKATAAFMASTKAAGETGVLQHQPDAVILRPSIVFGPEDQFFNRFAAMTRFGPVLPVVGAETRFQPVYVDDLAQAAVRGITGQAEGGVYEIGGSDVMSFRELMQLMLTVVERRRLVLNIPFWIGRVMGGVFGAIGMLSGGLVKGPITTDQVNSLTVDNVVSDGAKTLADIGVDPTTLETILPEYLWKFRPSGQYDDIQNSAQNLRT